MEDKTKKKCVQKRAVRKKTKATEPVSVAAPIANKTEAKRPRKSSKAKSATNTLKVIVHLPTFEQVQLRAYFISERRRQLGLPGDESRDWLTAEQELREELSV
jgi:Protein of unknown function (DUF2934)